MLKKIAPAWKTAVALAGAALTWGTTVVASPPGPPTAGEWLALGFAFLGVVGVYTVSNAPARAR